NKGEIKSYKIVLKYLERLAGMASSRPEPQTILAFKRLALRVLELDYALLMNGKKLPSTLLLEKIPESLRKWKIYIHRAPEGEAVNLVKPGSQLFYSPRELDSIKRNGGDVSRFNPPADSTFWTNHDISAVDVRSFYQDGGDALHRGVEVVFPKGKAHFKKIRRTQTKPKMDVTITHRGRKITFKLKIGAEMHSEISCAALYAAMGFSTDICKYVRDFKVILGQMTHQQFRHEWESYYGRYPMERFVKDRGTDEDGNYVVFHEGVLESKPEALLRVGPWPYGIHGHRGLREVRSALIFNMWVANLDIKEAENNKLILKKSGNGYRFFHIQHDMGYAFGNRYFERPGSFGWKLVKKRNSKFVRLAYRNFQKNSGFKQVTFADARWMIRLMAQLSRRQITDAIQLGGWPPSISQLLVEKLIARRNQLVKAFDLENETLPNGTRITQLPFDRNITAPDGGVKDGKLKIYEFPGYPQYFGPRLNEVIVLVMRGIRNMAVDSFVRLTGSMKSFKINPEWFGLDERIVSRVILRLNREIELNPLPKNENDTFLVKDSLEVGLRLGYGLKLTGDISYIKKYTLVYPVDTRDQGRFHNKFILNVLLPFKKRTKDLPPNHVIIVEDFVEGRFGYILRHSNALLQPSATTSKFFMSRYLLSRKNDKVVFCRDKSIYNEHALKLSLELLRIFRFPLFKASLTHGKLTRNSLQLDIADIESNSDKAEGLTYLLDTGSTAKVRKYGERRFLKDQFVEKRQHFTLFGFVTKRSVFRTDRVKEKAYLNPHPDMEATVINHYQVESRKLQHWNFLDNGERHFSSVRGSGIFEGDMAVQAPALTISMQINDKSTTSGELKNGYLHFLNTVASKKDFIDFDPFKHSVNHIWGYTQTFFNLTLYKEAIENLLNAAEDDIWRTLGDVTNQSWQAWKRKSRTRFYRGKPRITGYNRAKFLAVKTRYFIRELEKARKTDNVLKRMRLVVKAVRKSIYRDKHSFEALHLAVIRKLAGKKNYYMEGFVTMPENKEMVFPARTPFFNKMGKERKLEYRMFQFILDDPSEIYHLFN
ncbi:MAG: hypothetical protein GY765_24970, partial [bacterium]|nr:hypothetical protein [bacterium]